MSCYYSLVCEKCNESVDSCRRSGDIGPMADASELIWHFLYTHASHPLKNIHESSEGYCAGEEWNLANLDKMSSWRDRPEGK